MSKKEEALRRSVLSQLGPAVDREMERARRQRTVGVLAVAAMLGGIGLVPEACIDPDAEPGRFSSGAPHPYGCPCSKCAAWRKSRQRFGPKPWE